jgi:DNA invertase Pin-like site-specific DNA recombinase
LLHIYAALAEKEHRLISERTKAAMKRAKAKGVRIGGLRSKGKELSGRRKNALRGFVACLRGYPLAKRPRD